MFRKLFGIALVCALLAPAAAFAWPSECSPGFWKNHEKVWCGATEMPRCTDGNNPLCCKASIEFAFQNGCDTLLEWLNEGGACPGNNCHRMEATAFLNACFYAEWTPCPD